MGIWENVREEIIEQQGDISTIEGIPQHIKDIYKTSFTTNPYAFIEVAARAQNGLIKLFLEICILKLEISMKR